MTLRSPASLRALADMLESHDKAMSATPWGWAIGKGSSCEIATVHGLLIPQVILLTNVDIDESGASVKNAQGVTAMRNLLSTVIGTLRAAADMLDSLWPTTIDTLRAAAEVMPSNNPRTMERHEPPQQSPSKESVQEPDAC